MAVPIKSYQALAKKAKMTKMSFWSYPGPEGGKTQFEYVLSTGLQRRHKLLEVGCANLRAGIHFIDYLNKGNYYGVDKSAGYLSAARNVLKLFDLHKKPHTLLCNADFEFEKFGVLFDYAFAHSVLTHLLVDDIFRCLENMEKVLTDRGAFYATFFQISQRLPESYRGSFRYHFDQIKEIANDVDLQVDFIGDVGFENRNQMMLRFHKGVNG